MDPDMNDWLMVLLANGDNRFIPIRRALPNQPWTVKIGPLPPEVSELYEVVVKPTEWLVRKNAKTKMRSI